MYKECILKYLILFIVLFFSTSTMIFSQDTIYRTNGNVIIGKIKNEDSANVYFYLYKNNQRIATSINKNDVKAVIYGIVLDTLKTKKENRGFLCLSMGTSFAIGNYYRRDMNNNYSGYAGIGFNGILSYTYKINKYIGLDGKLYYSNNRCNVKVIEDALTLDGGKWSSFTSLYQIYGFMIGGSSFISIKKIVITSRISSGRMKIFTPDILFNASGYFGLGAPSRNNNFWTHNFGIGMMYPVSGVFNIVLNADYLYGNFYTKQTSFYWDNNDPTLHRIIGGNQKYNVINLTAGLMMKF